MSEILVVNYQPICCAQTIMPQIHVSLSSLSGQKCISLLDVYNMYARLSAKLGVVRGYDQLIFANTDLIV